MRPTRQVKPKNPLYPQGSGPDSEFVDWGQVANAPVSPNIALQNVRLLTDTADTATFGWTLGSDVAEVWAAAAVYPAPLPDDAWTAISRAVLPLPPGTQSLAVPKPADGHITLIQLEPRRADLTAGPVKRVTLTAAGQSPIIQTATTQGGSKGTLWFKLTERGIAVQSVSVQAQIGAAAPLSPVAPLRGPGAASTVKGGLLAENEYEHDIALDPSRTSSLQFIVVLVSGQTITAGPYIFDRDTLPNLVSVSVLGTVITIIADTDTQSVKVSNSDGSWVYWVDGQSATVDVTALGTNGVAGMSPDSADTFDVQAYAEPRANVEADTAHADRSVRVAGGAAPPPGASWMLVTASAPDADSDVAKITLAASGSPAGWSVRLWTQASGAGTIGELQNSTALVTPELSAPPTASAIYGLATGYERTASKTDVTLASLSVRAELLDAGGIVQDTKSVFCKWNVIDQQHQQ